jgi:hypothetical protein
MNAREPAHSARNSVSFKSTIHGTSPRPCYSETRKRTLKNLETEIV